MTTFTTLGVVSALNDALARTGITRPTDIQTRTLPPAFRGRDILAHSRTGTGKTLAFLLPILQRIRTDEAKEQALILAPTRELARQIAVVARPLAAAVGVDLVTVTGGATLENQLKKLKRRPALVIGTPGRILDHHERGTLILSSVRHIVLDEADQMLAMGFLHDVHAILDACAKPRQLLLFSATLPAPVRKLAKSAMRDVVSVNADGGTVVLDAIEQRIYLIEEDRKTALLRRQLEEFNPYLAIIFCNTKERATALAYELAQAGLPVEELQGDMSQSARNRILREFAKGRFPYLVASDIAARGIDIDGVSHVFNYDVPSDTDYYIHRIGRTGRAGRDGLAVTYVTPRDIGKLRRIEARIEQPLVKYDHDGNVKVKKPRAARRKVVLPGQYKPTKDKEHKQQHAGGNLRQRRKAASKNERKRGASRGKRSSR